MAEREEIMKLGVDASQVSPALRSIITQLGQYNRTVADVSNATVRFNRNGTASRITLTSLDKAGNSVTQTFKLLKDGIRQTSAALTENKNAQEQALRAMVRNQEEQKRLVRDNFQMQRQQTRDWQQEIMRRMRVADEERQHRAKMHQAMRADERRHAQEQAQAARVAARDAAVARSNLPGAQFATGLRSGFLRAGPPLLTGAVAAGSGGNGSIMGGLGGLAGGLAGTAATIGVGMAVGALTSALGAMARAWRDATIASGEFQKQVALIRTISQDAQLNMTGWQDGIIRLSNQFGRSKEEIAAGVYETLSAQVAKGAQAFVFMEEAMKLASVTGGDATSAVKTLAGVMNAYHMNATEANRTASIFFKAIDIGNGTLDTFASNAGRAAQMGSALGVPFEDLAGIWAVLTKNGVESHTAWTLLLNLMTQLQKPSEALTAQMRKWGVETSQQALAAGGLRGVLVNLDKAIKSNETSVSDLFPELRAMNAAIGATGQNLTDVLGSVEAVSAAQKDYNNAAKEFSETAGVRLDRDAQVLKNKLHELGDTTLRLAYVFRDDLFKAFVQTLPMTSALGLAFNQLMTNVRMALPFMEAMSAVNGTPSISTKSDPAQAAKEALQVMLKGRYEALNEHVNDMRKGLFALNDAEKQSMQETKDTLKSEMEVRLAAFEKLNQNLEKYISNLEKSRRPLKDIANEIRTIRATNFNDTRDVAGRLETTNPVLRQQIDQAFLNNRGDIGGRLAQVMRDLRSARAEGNASGLRQNFNDLRGLWGEQVDIQVQKFNSTQDVRYLQSIRDIQQLINQSRWDELRIIEQMAAKDMERAQRARRVLEEDKIKVREMKKQSGRLDELKPEDFNSIASAQDAFNKIASPLYNKALTMGGPEAGKLAQTLLSQRELFESQVRQHLAVKQLADAQAALKAQYESASQEVMKNGTLMSDSFIQAENSVLRATNALTQLRAELRGISLDTGPAAAFDKQNAHNIAAPDRQALAQQQARAYQLHIQTQQQVDALLRQMRAAMSAAVRNQLDMSGGIAPIPFASGGLVGGRGGVDQNIIRASNDEFIMNGRATRMFYPQIVAMNAMGLGGGGGGGDSTTFGDINVTVNGGRTTDETARSIGYAVRREMRRGTLNLRRK